jgi:hypothetical protein
MLKQRKDAASNEFIEGPGVLTAKGEIASRRAAAEPNIKRDAFLCFGSGRIMKVTTGKPAEYSIVNVHAKSADFTSHFLVV